MGAPGSYFELFMKPHLPVLLLALLAGTPASATDFATEVLNATFKLYHPSSTATCFLVRGEAPEKGLFLVTAAHVVERTKGESAILVLRQPKDDGSFDRRDHTIQIRNGDKPQWVRHPKQDVAVLRLNEPLPVEVAALPASALADEARLKSAGVHICSTLFLLTFPERFEANPAGFPVARQGIFASPPLLPVGTHPTFLADFTTFAGDSGGPAFIAGPDGHPLLMGLVLAQFRHDEKIVSGYEDRVIHHPLGLGSILHAHYVSETLKDAAAGNRPASK